MGCHFIRSFWELGLPGQVPSPLVAPEILEGYTLSRRRRVADYRPWPFRHVSSIGLVASGDTVYNDMHPYLAECDAKARNERLCAPDKIKALHPKAVIAGHGVLDPDSCPHHIEETRGYIRDFEVAAATSTAMGHYEKMLALHANRVNPGSLWQPTRFREAMHMQRKLIDQNDVAIRRWIFS